MATETAPEYPAEETGVTPGVARNRYLTDVWVNFMRWNLKSVRNPFVVFGSLIQPVVFLLLFSQVFGNVVGAALGGDVGYVTFLIPAIIIQVAIVAAATSGIGLVNDMESGMFEKVLASPMHRSAIFLGKILSELLRLSISAVVMILVGLLLGAEFASGPAGMAALVVVAVVFSFWFTAFSNVVALVTRDQESTIILTNVLVFPLLFVSSAFLPVETMPEWVQVIARYNPITFGVDAARTIVLDGFVWDALATDLGVLVGLDVVFGLVAVYFLTRASSAKVR